MSRRLGDSETYGYTAEKRWVGDTWCFMEVFANVEDELVDTERQFVRREQGCVGTTVLIRAYGFDLL